MTIFPIVLAILTSAVAQQATTRPASPPAATVGTAGKELPLPPMTEGQPSPGKFVKQVAPEYTGTQVYHALYLPADWTSGKLYPIIVEYAGNDYQPICTGKVEDCKLGFYQSGGSGFIWVVLPFVSADRKKNQLTWWGDANATADYCKANVPRIARQYGGDTSAIFVTGFSRGAIACGYIGLRDEEIADLWLGFVPHSHHDGGSFTADGARERLARIRGRASFLTWGSNDSGKGNSLAGKAILEGLKFPVTGVEIPGIDHTDKWITQDCPQRQALRKWLAETIRTKPGMHAISGTVTAGSGPAVAGPNGAGGATPGSLPSATPKGLAGVWVSSAVASASAEALADKPAKADQSGPGHWTQTDDKGRYTLAGLLPGKRTVKASKDGFTFTPAQADVTLADKDLGDVNFTAARK